MDPTNFLVCLGLTKNWFHVAEILVSGLGKNHTMQNLVNRVTDRW